MRRDPFQSIADPNRRKIIEILSKDSPLTMNRLAERFKISRPAISKHVRILEKSGVIEIQQIRVERFVYLKPESLEVVQQWVGHFLSNAQKTAPKKKIKEKPAKKAPTKKKAPQNTDEEDQLSLF